MIRGRRLACEALEERHLLSVFTVTEIGDSHLETGAMFANPVPGEIDTYALPSLRAAVEAANQHSGDDTIQFDPSLAGETIVLEDGELLLFDATAKTTIEGLGADQLAVSGDNTSRIFFVSGGETTISGLTIRDGYSSDFSGGAIFNGSASFSLIDCVVSNNKTDYWGGAICNRGTLSASGTVFLENSGPWGGAIFNDATTIVSQCRFSGNSAEYYGGAIHDRGSLTITGTTFENNSAGNQGGGVYNSGGPMTISDSVFSLNSAVYDGGGILQGSEGTGSVAGCEFLENIAYYGGGIQNYGAIDISGCNFAENAADYSGGGLGNFGTLDLADSTFSGNTADYGGGLYDAGRQANATGCTFTGNAATRYGGGISNGGALALSNSTLSENTSNQGGAIYVNTSVDNITTISGCTISDNSATESGGGIWNGGNYSNLTVSDCTISGNTAVLFGGGINHFGALPLTLTRLVVSKNVAEGYYGGGICSYGALDVSECLFDENWAEKQGGGVYGSSSSSQFVGCTFVRNSAEEGGALYNYNTSTSMVLDRCFLYANQSQKGGGVKNGGSLSFLNSTAVGNIAISSGGGICNEFSGTMTIVGSTIVGNTAVEYGGGVCNNDPDVTISNTIIAGNDSELSMFDDLYLNQSVVVNYCLIQNPSTYQTAFGVGNLLGVEPLLGVLGDYGGPTQTIPLLPGSPAIDAGGNDFVPAEMTTDQRGVDRMVGDAVDIGAYESRGFVLSVVAGDEQQTPVGEDLAVPPTVRVDSDYDEPVAGGKVTFVAPSSGAGLVMSPSNGVVTIDNQRLAQVLSMANDVAGVYVVTASTAGSNSAVSFQLVNVDSWAVLLSECNVAEDEPAGTVVGEFSTDPTLSTAVVYTLVDGEGDDDNALFNIDAGALRTADRFDFEARSSYSIRVRSTTPGGTAIEQTFVITVTNVNEQPGAIEMTNVSMAENQPAISSVGMLSTIDPDAGNTFTYTLVAGDGDADNAMFVIDGATLQTAAELDYEGQNTYNVRIRSTDQDGLWTEQTFVITATDANEPPTDILLPDIVDVGNRLPNVVIGTLSTMDPDAGDTFTYSIVEIGSDMLFTLDGDQLVMAGGQTSSPTCSYQVWIRATDQGGLFVDNIFSINVSHWSDTVSLYNPVTAMMYLEDKNTAGVADSTFVYGPANVGWLPVFGDWDGDGQDSVGLYDPKTSRFFLRDTNSAGVADITFQYGPVNCGWTPIVGDWNGDGQDTIGLYNPTTSNFYLRDTNSAGVADLTFQYGPVNGGWLPIAGDWDNDGIDTIGLYRQGTSTFYLHNSNSGGVADVTFQYGPANSGWLPIAGDWNVDGFDTVGLYAPTTSMFYLRNEHDSGVADVTFQYGPANSGWLPIIGNWREDRAIRVEGGPPVIFESRDHAMTVADGSTRSGDAEATEGIDAGAVDRMDLASVAAAELSNLDGVGDLDWVDFRLLN